ncbi:hypothetical protein G9U53_26190 [Rhodococcus sp. D-46]|uniref:P-loop NTPase fold protein n=1 Tax=Rhodococcus sp. D-46 TaxID=2716265 RepID=UPI0013F5AE95|nr:hypothetical protein [Rhodococcus sp. D-46]
MNLTQEGAVGDDGSEPGPADGTLYRDASITSFDDDTIGRETFARRVAARIESAQSGPSVVFGLAGPWGSGKTSVLTMIKLAMDKSDTWTVVEFTPWSANDPHDLIGEFYQAIADAMPVDSPAGRKARNLLMSAIPTTTQLGKVALEGLIDSKLGDGTWSKMAGTLSDDVASRLEDFAAPAPNPFRKQFDQISEAVKKTGRQVLVIVDDLDRLHVDELLTVLKSVRLLGRFPGVHYLLSYDRKTVLDLLSAADMAREGTGRAEAYLEKMVQYPFALPPLQSVHARREIREQISRIAAANSSSLTRVHPIHGRTTDLVDELTSLLPVDNMTLRAIYRWTGQVDTVLTLFGQRDLDLVDTALVTYLRLHHASVYDRLTSWRSELVGTPPRMIDMRSKHASVEDWLARLTTEPNALPEADAADVYKILYYLFPRLPQPTASRTRSDDDAPRVHLGEYFDRYFAFGLPEGDISDLAVSAGIETLLDTGELPTGEPLDVSLRAGGDIANVTLKKLRRELTRISTSELPTQGNELKAICHLKPILLGENSRFSYLGEGLHITVSLLQRAMKNENGDARETVNTLRQAFDLPNVATVLSMFRSGNANYSGEIEAAMQDVRDEILDICMRDLTEDNPPAEGQMLSFTDYLSPNMYHELRNRIDSSDLTQHDVAARMVRRTSIGLTGLREFFIREPFETIFPRAEWDLNQFPPACTAEDLPEADDYSLEARRTRASYAVRQIVAEAS